MKKLLLVIVAWFAFAVSAFAAVDINSASEADLQKLNGIGPVKAKAIVDYRAKNGPFKTVDDLEKVKGIGPGIVKKIRGDVTVGGAAPAPAAKAEAASGKKDSGKKPAKDDKKAGAK